MRELEPEGGPGPAGPPGVPGGTERMPPGPERYRAVLDNLDEVVFETDEAGRWTYLNAAWTRITGREVEDSLGEAFLEFVHPEERQNAIELFERVVEGPDDYCQHETRYLIADGTYRWIELRASMLFDQAGTYVGNVGTLADITERRHAEQQLDEQNRLLEMVARAEPLATTLEAIAGSLSSWTGYEVTIAPEPPLAPAGSDADGSAGPDAAGPTGEDVHEILICAVDDEVLLGRVLLRAKDGTGPTSPWPLDEATQSLVDRSAHLAAIAIGRERLDATARHQALHDPLTGLPNRALVTDRLQQAVGMTARSRRQVALLLLDLDQFKVINDTFGHDMGDRVLQEVSGRLRGALREFDTVGRLGGDEFAIVLPDVIRVADIEEVCRSVQRALRAPLTLDGVDFHLEGSIGVAVSSDVQDLPADLLRFADVAMYRAKRDGASFARYDAELDARRLRGFDLVGQLRHAIHEDQLVLHYQPKIALDSGAVVGMEALVRWQHPTRGLIGPGEFIPLAEMTGAVRPLLRWVLHRAFTDSNHWMEAGMSAMAVNISAQSLRDPELPALVGELIDAAGTSQPRLELEITESAIMADPDGAVAAMARIEDLGVSFSIDDFGTGYSSLTYLKTLPARTIKIDKSFVKHMDHDERDGFIVRTAVALAHDLGIGVVAEGVETREVSELLLELGCDTAQGFYFARPMPREQVLSWLADRSEMRGWRQ